MAQRVELRPPAPPEFEGYGLGDHRREREVPFLEPPEELDDDDMPEDILSASDAACHVAMGGARKRRDDGGIGCIHLAEVTVDCGHPDCLEVVGGVVRPDRVLDARGAAPADNGEAPIAHEHRVAQQIRGDIHDLL